MGSKLSYSNFQFSFPQVEEYCISQNTQTEEIQNIDFT
jgi:hypothetical protein